MVVVSNNTYSHVDPSTRPTILLDLATQHQTRISEELQACDHTLLATLQRDPTMSSGTIRFRCLDGEYVDRLFGIGLDWIGLDWIGLDWIGLDWIGLVLT
jgi:hypothetical protein